MTRLICHLCRELTHPLGHRQMSRAHWARFGHRMGTPRKFSYLPICNLRGGGAVGGPRCCWSVSLLPGQAAMRQERPVTRLDRHYLRTSTDVAIDDVGFIETTQPRPIAIGCSFRTSTGRAIDARHDVGADSIGAIGFHGRFGDGCWRRRGHRHCFGDVQCGRQRHRGLA